MGMETTVEAKLTHGINGFQFLKQLLWIFAFQHSKSNSHSLLLVL